MAIISLLPVQPARVPRKNKGLMTPAVTNNGAVEPSWTAARLAPAGEPAAKANSTTSTFSRQPLFPTAFLPRGSPANTIMGNRPGITPEANTAAVSLAAARHS